MGCCCCCCAAVAGAPLSFRFGVLCFSKISMYLALQLALCLHVRLYPLSLVLQCLHRWVKSCEEEDVDRYYDKWLERASIHPSFVFAAVCRQYDDLSMQFHSIFSQRYSCTAVMIRIYILYIYIYIYIYISAQISSSLPTQKCLHCCHFKSCSLPFTQYQ